ncbi:MAG: hypothetical protein WKF48_10250 [Solirubrobacteraceae bacterium]
MNRTRMLWTVALFFGCTILFRAIDSAAEGSPRGVSLAIQACAATVIVVAIIVIVRRRS